MVGSCIDLSATEGILQVLRRWLASGALCVGLAVVASAVCSATVWRPADSVTAQFKASSGTQAVITAPGVLEAQADSVEITVRAVTPVVVAVGRETDVAAWLGDSPAEKITGFTSREAFAVTETGSTEPILPASGSDLWVVSREFTSKEGTLRWDKRPEGRWSLVVAPAAAPEDSGAEAAVPPDLEGVTVTMEWPQQVSTPFLWPGVAGGGALAAGGLVWLVASLRGPRRERRAAEGAKADAGVEEPSVLDTPALVEAPPQADAQVSLAAPDGGPAAVEPAPRPTEADSTEPPAAAPPALEPLTPELATVGAAEAVPPVPRPAKSRRGWFRRRSKAAPAEPVAAPDPVTPEPPKLDLGIATPNRNWERLAAPQLHFPQDGAEGPLPAPDGMVVQPTAPASVPSAIAAPVAGHGSSAPRPVPGAAAWKEARGVPVAPDVPQPAEPGASEASGRRTGGIGQLIPPAARPATPQGDGPAVPGDPARTARTAPITGAPASMWGTGQLPPVPDDGLKGTDGTPPGRRAAPVTQAEKIAALRETHTNMADQAAATIAAAMAAASGAGSAAGLTRRQIREAERAAQDALRDQVQRTGEIPPWETFERPGLGPAVELQTGEEAGR
jgi:hypothetical protein